MRSVCHALMVAGVGLLAVAPAAMAVPSINWPTFLFNAPFQDNGNALGVNFGTLLMTTSGNQNSSTFVIASQDLTQSFTATYSFYIGSGSFGANTTSGTGPGGIAFVIQGDSRGPSALGGGGDQIGYGDGVANTGLAVQHSLALIYSTYGGSDQFELFTNTANGNFNAQGSPLATQAGSENLTSLSPSQIEMDYEAPDLSFPNGAVTVLLNNNSIGLNNVALPASLQSLAGGSTGYFGFTASTAGVATTGPEIFVPSLVVGAPVPEPASASIICVSAIAFLARRRNR